METMADSINAIILLTMLFNENVCWLWFTGQQWSIKFKQQYHYCIAASAIVIASAIIACVESAASAVLTAIYYAHTPVNDGSFTNVISIIAIIPILISILISIPIANHSNATVRLDPRQAVTLSLLSPINLQGIQYSDKPLFFDCYLIIITHT